jgi:hypothetical protein
VGFRSGIGATTKAHFSGTHGRPEIPLGQVIIRRHPPILHPVIQPMFLAMEEILHRSKGKVLSRTLAYPDDEGEVRAKIA